jgi:hypothetical protein
MSTIVTRAGKGSPLTWNEVDNNFTNLNTDKLQSGNTAAALTITSATINGGTITGTALNGTLGATTPSTAVVTSLTSSALTSGRVTFASTGGLLADSSNLIWDISNARLGVGTATPTTLLHVNGGTLRVQDSTGSGGYRLDIQSDATTSRLNSVDSQPMAFLINSSEKMRLSASGGLSIGTTTDAGGYTILLGNASYANTPNFNALNSSGQSSFGTQGTTAYGALAAGDAYVYTAKHVVLVSDSASGAIKFATGAGAIERMRLDSSGNLGLGVTPSANWGGGYKPVQIVNGAIYAVADDMNMASNVAYNGTTFKYLTSFSYPCNFSMYNGVFTWSNSYSTQGAGNTITFSTAMTLNNDGNLALRGGTTNASGVGITFPASQVASANANCLDDYEEGTWTAGFTSWTTAPTSLLTSYTKIGRQVTLFMVGLGGVCTAGSTITGIPFSAGSSGAASILCTTDANLVGFTAILFNNASTITNVSTASMTSRYWACSFTYFTN